MQMPAFLKSQKLESKLSLIATIYFILGFLFAFAYAAYYHWSVPFSYLSPGFFSVMLTWPIQAVGFVNDLLYYGLAGKPI